MSDAVWWERIAWERYATGDHIPRSWKVEHDDGEDGCMPMGWYAIGLDAKGWPIDWPIRHEYGPFRTERDARSFATRVEGITTGLSFSDGYRNGRADALLGLRSDVALLSPHAEYRDGYRKAQAEAAYRNYARAVERKEKT